MAGEKRTYERCDCGSTIFRVLKDENGSLLSLCRNCGELLGRPKPIGEWPDFVFNFGRVSGYMHRPETQKYFNDRGVPQESIDAFIKLASEIAGGFYREKGR